MDTSLGIIGGVDTHLAMHCVAAIDGRGALLATSEFPASPAGYRLLIGWLRAHGRVVKVGVEGSGSYGAGLTRALIDEHVPVVEVPRPDRRIRVLRGKSDPIDAEAAARSALAGTASSAAKHADGAIEAIRQLRVARNGAVKAKTAALNTLHALVVTAPEQLRRELEGLPRVQLLERCAGFRPHQDRLADPSEAAKTAMRSVARRALQLRVEADTLHSQLAKLVTTTAPRTSNLFALGPDTTAALLIAVGDNPDRLRSEAAFARLCGVAPIPASSGKTNRHRLHRGGDRSANRALHVAVVVRLRFCPRTRAYLERRRGDGLSKLEAVRCLKRFLAREVFNAIRDDYEALTA